MIRSKIYFGHPVNTYGTDCKRRLVHCIELQFPHLEVEDPDQEQHQAGYQQWKKASGSGMDYFFQAVLPDCCGGVFLAFRDGMFGAGVAGEARWLLNRGRPVWEISPDGDFQPLLVIPDRRILSIEETRKRIRDDKGNRIPY